MADPHSVNVVINLNGDGREPLPLALNAELWCWSCTGNGNEYHFDPHLDSYGPCEYCDGRGLQAIPLCELGL
jgi:hypothetical protein